VLQLIIFYIILKLLLASEKKWSSEFSALQAKLSEAYSSLEQDRKFKLENDELKVFSYFYFYQRFLTLGV